MVSHQSLSILFVVNLSFRLVDSKIPFNVRFDILKEHLKAAIY